MIRSDRTNKRGRYTRRFLKELESFHLSCYKDTGYQTNGISATRAFVREELRKIYKPHTAIPKIA